MAYALDGVKQGNVHMGTDAGSFMSSVGNHRLHSILMPTKRFLAQQQWA